jgi:hypothetical protein
LPKTTRSGDGGRLTLSYRCRSDDCGVCYDIEVPRPLSVQNLHRHRLDVADRPDRPGPFLHRRRRHPRDGPAGTVADFRTGIGSINAAFTSAPSHLGANAGTGAVTLFVPPGLDYDVTAGAGLGPVSASVRQDASSGHVIRRARTSAR